MTPVLTEDAIRRLPEPIVATLRRLIARIRRVIWWRGFWFTLASLVAVLLAIMAVDAAFDLESNVLRAALTFSGAAVVAAVAWRTLVRPLRRTFGLAQVARLVEIHHPEMHERISTAVELLGSRHAAGLRGSDELLAEVVKGAVTDVQKVDPEVEFPSLPQRRARRLAGAALAVLAGVLALWPFQGGVLVARALLPFANIGSAAASDLRVLTGDTAVNEGEPLTLLVAAKGRAARRVELRRTPATSATGPSSVTPTIERLLPQVSDQARPGETVFALTLPSVNESFRYAVTAGRARTRDYFIDVRRRPDITGLRVTYTFPAYTGLPARTDTDSPGDIAAIAGTRVEVVATLSQPAASAMVVYDQTENAGPEVTLDTENGTPVARWSAELAPGVNYRWTLHPKGAGDQLGKPAGGTLRALEDLPPAVVIDSPLDRELSLRPNEVIPIVYTAADDLGFSAADLRLNIDGKGERLIAMPLPEKNPRLPQTWHGTASLDLSTLPLAGASEVRVRLRVTDTLPADLGGPQSATAEDILIRLNWGAETFAQQTLRKQEDQLRRDLENIRNDLRDHQRQAGEKAAELRNPDQMDSERLQQLAQLTEKTAASAERLKEIAGKAAQSAFAERADAIEQTARNQVRRATESLEEIPQFDRPEDRSRSADGARQELESAARQIDEVLNAFQQDREQGQELGELASLAREQQQLADQAQQAAPAPNTANAANAANTPDTATTPRTPDTPPAQTGQTAQTAAPTAPPEPATANTAATNPLTDPTATPEQRQEAFERWQQQQDSVEHRALNAANQFQQKVPVDRQSDLAQLATRAQDLARQADALSTRQDEVAIRAGLAAASPAAPPPAAAATPSAPAAASAPAATTPPSGSPAPAQQQAEVATAASQLAESLAQWTREAERELRQNGKAGSQAAAATTALQEAATSGQDASRSLAAETGPPAAADTAAPRPEIPTPSPGQQAVARTATSLDTAAAALQEMARTLSGQAEGVTAATTALTAATAQTKQASDAGDAARDAGRQAADQARQSPETTPEAAAAAESAARLQALAATAAAPAQQAATNLALAAATAQAAMGLPENALNQQNMGQNGSPKPGDGQQGQSGQTADNNQPSNQPGAEATDAAGFQTTKDYGLPPELARLGMSADDWSRLRGLVTSGAEAAAGDQVPAEYRDLVRGYFRALSSGAAAPPGQK